MTLFRGSSSSSPDSSGSSGSGGGTGERLGRRQQPLELWSKLLTGEPSNLEATEVVAELVVRGLCAALR